MKKKTYYKLTNQNMQTYGGFQWEIGKWVKVKGSTDQELCTDGWLHCYDSPLLAVLHNPIHANIKNPRLFEVKVGGGTRNDRGLKRGWKKMRIIREIPIPEISDTQKIVYGILCAKKVCKDKYFNIWADAWLSGKDCSEAAEAAAQAAAARAAAAWAAAATEAAARAAAAAEAAARAAVWAAAAARAAAAAEAAARAAQAAAWAACAKSLNLQKIAEKAMKYEDKE